MTKQKQAAGRAVATEMELVAEDGVRLVAFSVELVLYTNVVLSQHAHAVLTIYERFREVCPEGTITFYATENMRRHKPVSKSTFALLPTWLKPGAPAREFVRLQLKDGEQLQDAPRLKFDVLGVEPKSKLFGAGAAGVVALGFPVDHAMAAPAQMRGLFTGMCEVFPFRSGHAGYALECSRYDAETSQTHAWTLSMRHPGLDIPRITDDSLAVGHDAVKGVGWLTALDDGLVRELGGSGAVQSALPREVDIIAVPRGVILQAGAEPAVGDANRRDLLPAYRSVFKLLAPKVEIAAKRSPSFNLATEYVERTERWYMRLGQ